MFLLLMPLVHSVKQEYTVYTNTTVLDDGTRMVQIHEDERYFQRDGEWEAINESLYRCTKRGKNMYCSKDYWYNLQAEDDGTIVANVGNRNATFNLKNILNFNFNMDNPVVEEGSITYEVIPGYVNFTYQFLPTRVKEIITLDKKLPFPPKWTNPKHNITFKYRGDVPLDLEYSFAIDSTGKHLSIDTDIDTDKKLIILDIDVDWFKEATYPVYIDPQLKLNVSNGTYEGYLNYDGSTYTRIVGPTNPTYFGEFDIGDIAPPEYRRHQNIYYNLCDYIEPSTLTSINKINFSFFVNNLGTVPMAEETDFHNLSKNHTSYPDSALGNSQFWTDSGDGTLYFDNWNISSTGYQLGNFTPQASTEMYNQIIDGSCWWGFGIKWNTEPGTGIYAYTQFRGSNAGAKLRRPFILVNYTSVAADTCTPPVGADWWITDKCETSTSYDITPYNLIINESGYLNITGGAIVNVSRWEISPANNAEKYSWTIEPGSELRAA